MEAQLADLDDVSVLHLAGELDHVSDAALTEALEEAEALGRPGIVVDLTAVTFMESRAFGILLALHRRFGDRLVIVCPGRELMKLFRAARLDDLFRIFPSVGEAVEFLSLRD